MLQRELELSHLPFAIVDLTIHSYVFLLLRWNREYQLRSCQSGVMMVFSGTLLPLGRRRLRSCSSLFCFSCNGQAKHVTCQKLIPSAQVRLAALHHWGCAPSGVNTHSQDIFFIDKWWKLNRLVIVDLRAIPVRVTK